MFAAQRRTNQSTESLETLTRRLADQAMSDYEMREGEIYELVIEPDRARPDRPRPEQVRRRQDQGGRLPRHQPQHAEQEGEGTGDRHVGLRTRDPRPFVRPFLCSRRRKPPVEWSSGSTLGQVVIVFANANNLATLTSRTALRPTPIVRGSAGEHGGNRSARRFERRDGANHDTASIRRGLGRGRARREVRGRRPGHPPAPAPSRRRPGPDPRPAPHLRPDRLARRCSSACRGWPRRSWSRRWRRRSAGSSPASSSRPT